MNNQIPYTHTRGWGAPAVSIVFGGVFVLGGAWLILADLFKKVGTDVSATIVLLSGSCLVGGVLLALVVVALVQATRDRQWNPPMPPVPASYEVLPATRQPPVLLPASNSLTRFQSSSAQQAELAFRDQPSQFVPLAAVEAVIAMDRIRRPADWAWANSAYGHIKRWLVANRYATAEDGKAGVWVNRDRARAVVQEWRKKAMQ